MTGRCSRSALINFLSHISSPNSIIPQLHLTSASASSVAATNLLRPC